MTSDEALDMLASAAIRPHDIHWELSGGGAGEPGGKWVIKRACTCLIHTLREAVHEDVNKPCNCGAADHNFKVMEAIRRLRQIIRLFDKATEEDCTCEYLHGKTCVHCELVIEARSLIAGTEDRESQGN